MYRRILLIMSLAAVLTMSGTESKSIELPKDCIDFFAPCNAPYIVTFSLHKNIWTGDKQEICVYSSLTGEQLWSTEFVLDQQIQVTDYGILATDFDGTQIFSFENGDRISNTFLLPVFIDDTNSLMIGTEGKNNKKIAAISLKTGERLWENEIGKNLGYYWNETCRPDSCTMFFSSDYAGRINLTTGEIKTFPLEVKASDKKGNLTQIGLGALQLLAGAGSITGTTVYYTPKHLNGLGSKMISDSDGRFYVADRNKLLCLDSCMNEVWKYDLPKGYGSRSAIYLSGDTLCMFNDRMISENGKTQKFGKTFTARFNRHTGEELEFVMFPEEWDKNTFGKNLTFAKEPIILYDSNTETFYPIGPTSDDTYAMIGRNGEAIFTDFELDVKSIIPAHDIYYNVASTNDEMVITQWGKKPVFIHVGKDGKAKANYDGGNIKKVVATATTLLIPDNNRLHIIDCSDSMTDKKGN